MWARRSEDERLPEQDHEKTDIEFNNSWFTGRAQNPQRRRPPNASASSSLDHLDGPAPGYVPLMSSPTRPRQENAPTSVNELLLGPGCAPTAATAVAHDPFLPRGHPSQRARRQFIVPSRHHWQWVQPPLLTAIGVGSTTARRTQALIQIQPATIIATINRPNRGKKVSQLKTQTQTLTRQSRC